MMMGEGFRTKEVSRAIDRAVVFHQLMDSQYSHSILWTASCRLLWHLVLNPWILHGIS